MNLKKRLSLINIWEEKEKTFLLTHILQNFSKTIEKLISVESKYVYAYHMSSEKFSQDLQITLKHLGAITSSGMEHHFLSHFMYYFLLMSGVRWTDEGNIVFGKEHYKEDKYGLNYDIYVSFLVNIPLKYDILDLGLIEKNMWEVSRYFESFAQKFDEEISQELQKIFERNAKKIFQEKRLEEQLYMMRYLQLADLLWVMNVGFTQDFSIDSLMFLQDVKEFTEIKPIFMLEIFQEVFWQNTTLEITRENYYKMKENFQISRKNFLISSWVQNIHDKKEISKKLMQKFQ